MKRFLILSIFVCLSLATCGFGSNASEFAPFPYNPCFLEIGFSEKGNSPVKGILGSSSWDLIGEEGTSAEGHAFIKLQNDSNDSNSLAAHYKQQRFYWSYGCLGTANAPMLPLKDGSAISFDTRLINPQGETIVSIQEDYQVDYSKPNDLSLDSNYYLTGQGSFVSPYYPFGIMYRGPAPIPGGMAYQTIYHETKEGKQSYVENTRILIEIDFGHLAELNGGSLGNYDVEIEIRYEFVNGNKPSDAPRDSYPNPLYQDFEKLSRYYSKVQFFVWTERDFVPVYVFR